MFNTNDPLNILGQEVYYVRPSYGIHNVIKFKINESSFEDSEYLLQLDSHRFYSNMDRIKYINTPDNISYLRNNEIFVFGSNLLGRHGKGAAMFAKLNFGAQYGVGEGLTGKCYAFPTLDKNLKRRTLSDLLKSAFNFYEIVEQNPDKQFLLTKVGTGLAGYKEDMIKLLFSRNEINLTKPKNW